MTKKDYEAAAQIAQNEEFSARRFDVVNAFVMLFRNDNERFDESRFRLACVPGANVKARPRKRNAA